MRLHGRDVHLEDIRHLGRHREIQVAVLGVVGGLDATVALHDAALQLRRADALGAGLGLLLLADPLVDRLELLLVRARARHRVLKLGGIGLVHVAVGEGLHVVVLGAVHVVVEVFLELRAVDAPVLGLDGLQLLRRLAAERLLDGVLVRAQARDRLLDRGGVRGGTLAVQQGVGALQLVAGHVALDVFRDGDAELDLVGLLQRPALHGRAGAAEALVDLRLVGARAGDGAADLLREGHGVELGVRGDRELVEVLVLPLRDGVRLQLGRELRDAARGDPGHRGARHEVHAADLPVEVGVGEGPLVATEACQLRVAGARALRCLGLLELRQRLEVLDHPIAGLRVPLALPRLVVRCRLAPPVMEEVQQSLPPRALPALLARRPVADLLLRGIEGGLHAVAQALRLVGSLGLERAQVRVNGLLGARAPRGERPGLLLRGGGVLVPVAADGGGLGVHRGLHVAPVLAGRLGEVRLALLVRGADCGERRAARGLRLAQELVALLLDRLGVRWAFHGRLLVGDLRGDGTGGPGDLLALLCPVLLHLVVGGGGRCRDALLDRSLLLLDRGLLLLDLGVQGLLGDARRVGDAAQLRLHLGLVVRLGLLRVVQELRDLVAVELRDRLLDDLAGMRGRLAQETADGVAEEIRLGRVDGLQLGRTAVLDGGWLGGRGVEGVGLDVGHLGLGGLELPRQLRLLGRAELGVLELALQVLDVVAEVLGHEVRGGELRDGGHRGEVDGSERLGVETRGARVQDPLHGTLGGLGVQDLDLLRLLGERRGLRLGIRLEVRLAGLACGVDLAALGVHP